MSKVSIEVNGVEYPAYVTLGAMTRFKDETGKEVTEIGTNDISLLARYMWCCVMSACHRECRKFEMPFQDFADSITPDVVGAWSAAITDGEKGEKKSS